MSAPESDRLSGVPPVDALSSNTPDTPEGAAVGPTDQQTAYIAGLREFVDFLEANPDLTPQGDEYFCHYAVRGEDLADLARSAGGRWEKEASGDSEYFHLNRQFGPHRFALYTMRDNVCERVVVGTETLTREIPDPELVAQVPTVTVTEQVEHVEYVCPPSLLGSSQNDR